MSAIFYPNLLNQICVISEATPIPGEVSPVA
jgi:hypothetical protein